MNIRTPTTSDLPDIKLILRDTDLFPAEMLEEMIEPFFAGLDDQQRWLVCESDGSVVGFSFTRAEALAEGAWNLLAIGFRRQHQGKGLGNELVAAVESSLQHERILIVETSSLESFAATRHFYEARGYTKQAVIPDYWAAGDHKVIYWKSLTA